MGSCNSEPGDGATRAAAIRPHCQRPSRRGGPLPLVVPRRQSGAAARDHACRIQVESPAFKSSSLKLPGLASTSSGAGELPVGRVPFGLFKFVDNLKLLCKLHSLESSGDSENEGPSPTECLAPAG
jgi:hypothetical protein